MLQDRVGLSEGRWPQGKCRSYGAKNSAARCVYKYNAPDGVGPTQATLSLLVSQGTTVAGHSRPESRRMSHRKTCRDRATHHRGFPRHFRHHPVFSCVPAAASVSTRIHTRYQADKVSEPDDLPAACRAHKLASYPMVINARAQLFCLVSNCHWLG